MSNLPILSLLTFLPLVGAGFILFVRGDEKTVARNSRYVALWTSVVTFLLSLYLWFNFDISATGFQFTETAKWMPTFNISYRMGVDGISVLFVLLSTLLTPISILASWESITERVKEYMIAFLVMETMMIGTFSALDLFLFYVFFEAVLIPMFIIIGVWGGPRRVYSTLKFFLYTLLGSVFMMLAILAMYHISGTSDIASLMSYRFSRGVQIWLWLAFFASFAVKIPMWPVHTWLPDAHVEAPTAGSVILAAVLLKFGGYGFLRFSLPMFPDASVYFAPLIFTLSIIAVIYTSLVALVQEDMKKLIAYSSIAHMGFVTAGTFTLTQQGIEGAIYTMLNHGIVAGALFLIVGVVYDRMHSRLIETYGGLVHKMPFYAMIFMLFTLAGVGLPGTGGFVGEFLVLVGVFKVNSWVAAFVTTGVILSASYMLYMYRRIIFGKLTKDSLKAIMDLSGREVAVFAPLVVLVLWMGIYPVPFLNFLHASVGGLVAHLDQVGAVAALSGQ